MATPKPKPTPKKSEKQRVEDVLKQHQNSISSKGVAAAEAAAKAAIEKQYPNLFVPKTRRTAGLRGD
jgi:hypothetical protein